MNSKRNYCLITGASKGIGKALAEECAKREINLFLVALPKSGLEETVTSLAEKNQIDIKFLSIDLTKKDAPKRVYDYAKSHNLKIDKLINNAGVGGYGEMEKQSPEEVDNIIMLNIRATTLLTYYFLSDLQKFPKAHILNISSFAAFIPFPNKSIYAATKTYILFFSRALNAELKGTSVKVTSVHPNGVKTNSRIKESLKNVSMIAKITTLEADTVARYAIEGMIKGKKLIVPGWATRFFYILGSIIPYGFIVRIVGWAFRKT
ncbi:MAG: SDR family NAD(P)-dependent oxidoreductase [Chlorobi bacterium]|nr:SDR family NAD(P)-dependent oxidoreductase [Chlorobiota bacterium]